MRRIKYFCIVGLIVLGPIASRAQEQTWVTWEERQRLAERERAEREAQSRRTVQRPSAPTPAAPSTRVTRDAQPATATRPSAARPASARPGAPPSSRLERFQLVANLDAAILYLEPMDVAAKVGEEFTTAVRLSNPQSRGFTRMFLALQYNPDVLLPLEVNDLFLQGHMQAPARALVYESNGLLTYEAEFSSALAVHNRNLITIKWHALAPVRHSTIAFSSFDQRDTSLASQEADILGEPGILGDGTIGATVRVLAPSPEDEGEFLTGATITEHIGPANIGGVKLTLRGNTRNVRVGENFLVDIDFENAQQAPVDMIHLIVRFDPRVLQVVDYDEENWISRGVNVYDGAYHDQFPFDYHIKNDACNTKGEIQYHVGISESHLLAARGTLATIVFRAIRPAENTSIFFLTPPRLHGRGTRVSYMGINVLGDLTSGKDGVENLAMAVIK